MSFHYSLRQLAKQTVPTRNRWPEFLRVKGAMAQFKAAQGYAFDIRHPVLFTEKIIWYKLFYQRDDLIRVVDKYLFKDYIREKLGDGYTVPLLGAWETVEDFARDWDKLPEAFCLKSTLMSNGRCIKVICHKSAENREALFREVREWLDPRNTLINSYCLAYYDGTPRILAEEYLSDLGNDYKVFCFQGEPYCTYNKQYNGGVYAGKNSDSGTPTLTFFDINWKKMGATLSNYGTEETAPPEHYAKMLEISRVLSEGFPFVRVDFFDYQGKLYVGEMTLYPSGGLSRYEPRSFNEELGRRFVLPEIPRRRA